MRQVGTLSKEVEARLFSDFLLTKGIHAQADPDGGEWAVWVRDEDHLAQAREELEDFRRRPDDPRYRKVAGEAQAIRQQEFQRRDQARKNSVEMRGRWRQGGMPRRCPLVFGLIGICVFVALLTGNSFRNQDNLTFRLLQFKDPLAGDPSIDTLALGERFRDIQRGQFWRLITPIFLHAGVMHIGFNMYMLYFLGSQFEDARGSLRFLMFVLGAALISVCAQAILDSPYGGGMSGVDYALFGYVWMRWRFVGESGFMLSQLTVIIVILFFFFGFSQGTIANAAHAFGFGYGIALGYAPLLFRSK